MSSAIVAAGTAADQGAEPRAGSRPESAEQPAAAGAPFRVEVERFADVRILRYRVPGFEALDARTKELLYYLYEAALCGREMTYDQKYRYNLGVKRTLEQIVRHYPGDRDTADFRELALYLKRVWFANGIHHHYGHDKLVPGFSRSAFAAFVRGTPAEFPVREGQSLDELVDELTRVMFDRDRRREARQQERGPRRADELGRQLLRRPHAARGRSVLCEGRGSRRRDARLRGDQFAAREDRRRAGRAGAEDRRTLHASHRAHRRLARKSGRPAPRPARSARRSRS